MDATRFARLATEVVVRRPALWRLLRGPLRAMFDSLASTWETRIRPHHLWAVELAVADVAPPRRILDVGTGTGIAAKWLAERFPEADVVGVDLSAAMVEEARQRLPSALAGRVRFEPADAAALPFPEASFELVVLMNMIPFFDELARVTSPGGALVVSFSKGDETPIYVAPERLRQELGRRGFAEFAEFSQPPATALRAARR